MARGAAAASARHATHAPRAGGMWSRCRSEISVARDSFGAAQREAVTAAIARAVSLDQQLVRIAGVEQGDSAGVAIFELQVYTDSVATLDDLARAGAASCPQCDKFGQLNALVAATANATLSAAAHVQAVDFACVSCGTLVI